MFLVIEAENGKIGEKIAITEFPDLIISDLMMPEMNGVELCKKLKSNIQTSHIPFIMLTAKSSDKAKMEGYEAGADSYIPKPFNFDVLLTRIRKLIEQQEKRKELFHKTIEITPSSITTNSLDEELVKKALLYVERNMDNTEYSVDDLSSDIGLSRSQLYRKLQSITGLTPIEFIRSIRLKRAAQLLLKSQYNVSEITDMVGFSTHKYFNKYFKEEYGLTPTQFRQENNKEKID
jgi:YesN/AraC family two-component response regulator